MVLPTQKRAVGAFPNLQAAEAALNELQAADFPMDRVSVVGPDSSREAIAVAANNDNNIENQGDQTARAGTIAGGALGGLAGVLVGIGALTIPGVGPIILGGTAATALASTLAGGAAGAFAGGLVGGMASLGIPEQKARTYSDWVSRGGYLVLVEGSEDEIGQAEIILSRGGVQDWLTY